MVWILEVIISSTFLSDSGYLPKMCSVLLLYSQGTEEHYQRDKKEEILRKSLYTSKDEGDENRRKCGKNVKKVL